MTCRNSIFTKTAAAVLSASLAAPSFANNGELSRLMPGFSVTERFEILGQGQPSIR